jgi:hypothetical protein
MRRLLMRVFSVELRLSFLPWAKVVPLKGPRSRWIGIPRYPEHRQLLLRLLIALISRTLATAGAPLFFFYGRHL